MKRKSKTRIYLFLSVGILACAAISFIFQFNSTPIYAAEKSLILHSIYLGKHENIPTPDGSDSRGDATLIESDGEYLLVDGGTPSAKNYLVSYLTRMEITKLDVMISHLHGDHSGGILALLKSPYFTIEKLYLPNKIYASEEPKISSDYDIIENAASSKGIEIHYLSTGDQLDIGSSTMSIIGPVGNYTIQQFVDRGYSETSGHYINNYSLTAIVSNGVNSVFLGGDTQEDEEMALLEEYDKSTLKVDIMKLSHHGIDTSNKKAILAAFDPDFFFGSNSMHYVYNPKSNDYFSKRTANTIKRIREHGFYYMTGETGKDLMIDASSERINLYKGGIHGTLLKGKTKVSGGISPFRPFDIFYLEPSTGKPRTNIFVTSNGTYYNYGKGGAIETGAWSGKGKYLYWRNYEDGKRYYTKSGKMAVGFQKIKKERYYFSEEGIIATGLTKVGKNEYYFHPSKGAMVAGKRNKDAVSISSKIFLINKNGTVVQPGWVSYPKCRKILFEAGKTKLFSKPSSKGTYISSVKAGEVVYQLGVKGKWLRIKTQSGKVGYIPKKNTTKVTVMKRYVGGDRSVYTGFQKINGSQYYFAKDAYMSIGLTKISKKYYYFSNKGKLKINSKVKINGKTYKTNSKGIVKKYKP